MRPYLTYGFRQALDDTCLLSKVVQFFRATNRAFVRQFAIFYSCLHTWSLCIAASDRLLLWPPYLLFACSVVLCGSLPSAPICDAISSNSHQLFFGSWLLAGIRPVCSRYRKPCTFSLPFACDMGNRVAYVLGYRLRCHTTIASLLHRDL